MSDTIVTGARSSTNALSAEKMFDFDRDMKDIFEYNTPIMQKMMFDGTKRSKATGKRTKFTFKQRGPLARVTTLVSAIAGGAATEATISVNDAIFRKDDIFFVESTSQLLRVTNDVTTGTINVATINGANISAAAIGATLRNLAPAKTEVYSRQRSKSNAGETVDGYCSIGMDALEFSRREVVLTHDTVDEDFENEWNKKVKEVAKYEERKHIYMGAAYDNTSDDITYSWGARGAYTQNVKYWAGDLDDTELDDMLEVLFAKQDTSELFGYAGGKYVKSLNKLMKQTHNYNVSADRLISAYGGLTTKGKGAPQVLEYVSPFGVVKFIYNPMLEGEVYSKSCLFLNWDYVSMKYVEYERLNGGVYMVEPDVQDKGAGSQHDQLIWDTGLNPGPDIYGGWHLPS